MTVALAKLHYSAIFSAWVAAGGIDASMRGERHALSLLGLLGDIDGVVVDLQLELPLPRWAR